MPPKKFAWCACFYEQNIFIPNWNQHVRLTTDDQFRVDHQNDPGVEEALAQAKAEVERRKKSRMGSHPRRQTIQTNYSPLFPSLFEPLDGSLQSSRWFNPEFKAVTAWSKLDPGPGLPPQISRCCPGVFRLSVFEPDFCQMLIAELKNLNESGLELERPNSMNRHGVLLDDLPFFDQFLVSFRQTLEPIFHRLFPQFGAASFDSHKSFAVFYKAEPGFDTDLAAHFDNSEVTINVSLSQGHEGGELVFSNDGKTFGVEHELGVGLLHLGSYVHQALPLLTGERWNLIMWLRSSDVRNQQCPMCQSKPQKILAPQESMGDGFTDGFEDQESAVCDIM